MDFDFVKQQPVLQNAPLRVVICQLRFPLQVGIGEVDIRPVQKALADTYPRPEIGKVAGLTLGPGGVAAGEPESVFHFRSEDQQWTVTITANSLSLETTAYVEDQVKLLAEFNHGAYELFSWAVTPEHFATFQPQEVSTSA